MLEMAWKLSRKDSKNEKILIAKVTAGAKGESKSADVKKISCRLKQSGGHLVCNVSNF